MDVARKVFQDCKILEMMKMAKNGLKRDGTSAMAQRVRGDLTRTQENMEESSRLNFFNEISHDVESRLSIKSR